MALSYVKTVGVLMPHKWSWGSWEQQRATESNRKLQRATESFFWVCVCVTDIHTSWGGIPPNNLSGSHRKGKGSWIWVVGKLYKSLYTLRIKFFLEIIQYQKLFSMIQHKTKYFPFERKFNQFFQFCCSGNQFQITWLSCPPEEYNKSDSYLIHISGQIIFIWGFHFSWKLLK